MGNSDKEVRGKRPGSRLEVQNSAVLWDMETGGDSDIPVQIRQSHRDSGPCHLWRVMQLYSNSVPESYCKRILHMHRAHITTGPIHGTHSHRQEVNAVCVRRRAKRHFNYFHRNREAGASMCTHLLCMFHSSDKPGGVSQHHGCNKRQLLIRFSPALLCINTTVCVNPL